MQIPEPIADVAPLPVRGPVVVINEEPDRKFLYYRPTPNGANATPPARIILEGKGKPGSEQTLTPETWEAIRRAPAARASLEGWAKIGAIRVYSIRG